MVFGWTRTEKKETANPGFGCDWIVADVRVELCTGSAGPSTPSEQAAALAGTAQKKVGTYKTISGMLFPYIYICL